jgi:hypothetical protein
MLRTFELEKKTSNHLKWLCHSHQFSISSNDDRLFFRNKAAGAETEHQQQDQAHGHQTHVGGAVQEMPAQAAIFRQASCEQIH